MNGCLLFLMFFVFYYKILDIIFHYVILYHKN
nr:MAG TPA: hypothetical protein [Ackermannviridae sp.]